MKKLMIMATATMAILAANATVVKYSDIYAPNNQFTSNNLASAGVTYDTQTTFEDMKAINDACGQYIYNNCFYYKNDLAVDDFLVRYVSTNNISMTMIEAKYFPKAFVANVDKFEKRNLFKQVYKKYGKMSVANISANDAIALLNAGEMNANEVDQLNEILKNEGVKIVKKFLRKNGKTFVAKKDAKGNLIFNPLQQPMRELTDSLNAAKYKGFNEWSKKYDANWKELDISWLMSDENVRKLMDDILIDEATINNNVVTLRIALGVDGFNSFIKEYNEGSAQ